MDIEFEKVYNQTIDTIHNNDDLYTNLMMKEDKVIDMVNRVIDQKQKETAEANFQDASIKTIVYRVFTVIFGVMNDIMALKPVSVIFRRSRILYIGIFTVFVSLCFILLYKIDK
jgi:hypothetical protein